MRVCDDVLIGILSFGRRRYFAMLEPHGTRFQYFIDRYWPEAPLLILDMDCWTYEKDDDKVLLPDLDSFSIWLLDENLKRPKIGSFLFNQTIGRVGEIKIDTKCQSHKFNVGKLVYNQGKCATTYIIIFCFLIF